MAATVHYGAFLAVIFLILQSYDYNNIATADESSPSLIAPFFGDVCNETVCGRGTCMPTLNTTFGFECECEDGWAQSRPQGFEYLNFLPCVVPNCTLNYTCANEDNPRNPNFERSANLSIFDPCYWADCGRGRCLSNSNSTFVHTCECEEGFYNLLNATIFPCFSQCAFGEDCPGLGLNTSEPLLNPFLPANDATNLISGGDFACLIIMAITLARVFWK
ncbi:hypothetical protein CDL12_19823 [Handroanthus impetiginosus]|uniref:EGF-like domain-containing protein n=1 Tax=Handroanthus impetiginosus TaxID=429701 RepID=A0A2G9GQR0_9LAMI|nr:hypothetical protein CDL12_19823 [Handroanthus impetiginosus]